MSKREEELLLFSLLSSLSCPTRQHAKAKTPSYFFGFIHTAPYSILPHKNNKSAARRLCQLKF